MREWSIPALQSEEWVARKIFDSFAFLSIFWRMQIVIWCFEQVLLILLHSNVTDLSGVYLQQIFPNICRDGTMARLLMAIVVVFLCCHSTKIIVNFYEAVQVRIINHWQWWWCWWLLNVYRGWLGLVHGVLFWSHVDQIISFGPLEFLESLVLGR